MLLNLQFFTDEKVKPKTKQNILETFTFGLYQTVTSNVMCDVKFEFGQF